MWFMIKLRAAGATHVGLIRTNNEDAYLVKPETGLAALSDGMGGAAAGEIASRYFIQAVHETFGEKSGAGRGERCPGETGIQAFE